MTNRHVGEEQATVLPTSKKNRGSGVSKTETKVSDVPINAPTISSVSLIGTTAYVTASYSQNSLGGVPKSFTLSTSPNSTTKTVSSLNREITLTGLSSNTSYTFLLKANTEAGSSSNASSGPLTTTITSFSTGTNLSGADLHEFATQMAGGTTTNSPSEGGTLTINFGAVGSYDYIIKRGNQNVITFNSTDWFTATQNTRSAFIVVDGDLTIGKNIQFKPNPNKLFTCIYVTGNLQLDGSITMSGRGANHSSIGERNIRLHTGTFSGVVNPQVPAQGGSGGARNVRTSLGSSNGAAGSAGTSGGTGGGGAGVIYIAGSYDGQSSSGAGAAGTCFTGGTGGGSAMIYGGTTNNATNGATRGGAGGNAGDSQTYGAGGGAGNPAGYGYSGTNITTQFNIANGTAGTLCIFVKGVLTGGQDAFPGGPISSNGHGGWIYSYPYYMQAGGGSGGGGSVTIFSKYDDSTITPIANSGGGNQNNGGAGTARKLTL